MRLHITKTPKCYVGGAFIRSESGRVAELHDASGEFFANIPQCTRKDLRNAVEAAAKIGPGWAKRTAFNRGQILYRMAEMIEARSVELAEAIMLGGSSKSDAAREVAASIERIVHYAGWTDKYEQILGSVNPVASSHFNFTVTEPMGIIGIIAPDDSPLLALVSLILPAITSGNSVVALASTTQPYPSILLGEMLATSDLPGGVVNLLTGFRSELLKPLVSHMDINAVVCAEPTKEERQMLDTEAATNMKRVVVPKVKDWSTAEGQSPYLILDTQEVKTTWHPIERGQGGGGGY